MTDIHRTVRTALFGGSFNPVHFGHLALARQVLAEDLADEVWLMVSPQNPLKAQADLLPEEARLAMALCAVKDLPGIEASDFEFYLPRPSYTYRTLEALETAYPTRCFSLLIGSDNWNIFPRWVHYEKILSCYNLIIYPREGSSVDPASLPENVNLLQAPLFPFSSTEVRNAIRTGKGLESLVPKEVAETIEREGYYNQ